MAEQRSGIDRTIIADVLREIVADAQGGRPAARVKIGLMAVGSEHIAGDDHGQGELLNGALRAIQDDPSIEVVMIGPKHVAVGDNTQLSWIETEPSEAAVVCAMNEALENKTIAGAVALHYPFPIGVATIGRVVTPLMGREMLIASTTGASSPDRVEAMVRNSIAGIAVAKSIGIAAPTVGILNVDGAPSVLRILEKLRDSGYDLTFGSSVRKDGGSLLRGNDILAGAVDVCVTDTLTGNILMKLFSSWNNGGSYETTGFGYGPSVGEGWDKIVSIISRASGAPVIANAVRYTARAAAGNLPALVKAEYEAANRAGLKELLASLAKPVKSQADEADEATPPPAEPTGEEIHGVDVLSIDDATRALWRKKIYAEASMGCTGPVVKVPSHALKAAEEALRAEGYL